MSAQQEFNKMLSFTGKCMCAVGLAGASFWLGNNYGRETAREDFMRNAKPLTETIHSQRVTLDGDTVVATSRETVAYKIPAAEIQ